MLENTAMERPTHFTETLLKRTTSRCPVCHAASPAEVWRMGDRVMLRRRCSIHGFAEACIASDARFYWLAQGKPENQCCGGTCRSADGAATGTLGRNAAAPVLQFRDAKKTAPEQIPGTEVLHTEKLATCLALIEIVNSCNLACPTCYADSPQSGKVDAVPLADIQRRIEGVIARKGGIEILQLSGGEPTLHPQFTELVAWLHAHPKIDYVLLNTNGVRLATDEAFAAALARVAKPGHFQLYLQFDGPQEAGQRTLRGADLREIRRRCVERCRSLGLTVTLAMTVTPDTLPHAWATVEWGLAFANVRGVSFQPVFGSGRTSAAQRALAGPAPQLSTPPPTLNTADVILGLIEQSGGKLSADSFTPLPCGDPNCATIGYLLKMGGTVRSISEFVDFTAVQDFLRDKVRYSLDDLARCGCENEPLAELLQRFELDASHTFRLFLKPFMDSWTWDEDRIDRCCTHVIRPDGALDSFCRYYAQR